MEAQPLKRSRGRPKGSGVPLPNKKLTRKQELFVKELVSGEGRITKRQAATNAGYPAKSAHQRAYELTNPAKCPHVVKAIREYRRELDKKYGVEYKKHVRDLQRIRDKCLEEDTLNLSAAVQAEFRRGQVAGLYINRSEIKYGSIDQMDKSQVEAELRKLREEYGAALGNIIDVTPEEEASGEPALEEL